MIQILNNSKGTRLADQAEFASSFVRRLVGLLGRLTLPSGQALVLKPCRSVHSFFMLFAIDVIFINQQGEVLVAIQHMRPFSMCLPVRGAAAAVELPAGTIERSATEPGDSLQFLSQ